MPVCGLASLLFLSGCSSEGSAEWRALYDIAVNAFTTPPGVSLDEAAAIPYATLGFRIDGGRENIAVLATDDGHQKLWASGKQIILVTVDGRIQRTVGLEQNLSWSTISAIPENEEPLDYWQRNRELRWTADFNSTGRYGIQVSCNEHPAGRETITVLGTSIATLRVDARCRGLNVNWSFDDVYWVGISDGIVWRSIQHIHPALGPIELETLRPAQ